MNESIIIVGLGQMGGTFAHGFLRQGHPVFPVTRRQSMHDVAAQVPAPALVLVAVGEDELDAVLESVPVPWRDRLALLQNELLPGDWTRHGVVDPTVAVVWFEKKKGTAAHAILPTVVAGPHRAAVAEALSALDIPARAIPEGALLLELVRKNLYILTANIAGLEVGGTVGELWEHHQKLASEVASEVIALQAWRADTRLPERPLIDAMVEAFEADPDHRCKGRSAPARLRRALEQAQRAELELPTLERIASEHLR